MSATLVYFSGYSVCAPLRWFIYVKDLLYRLLFALSKISFLISLETPLFSTRLARFSLDTELVDQ